MSEIQVVGDANAIKWVITSLLGVAVSLIIYIWRKLKKDFSDFKTEMIGKYKFIRQEQSKDHDMLIRIDEMIHSGYENKN